ncbi:phage tail assembly chaperone [Hungatella effluvii]|nr:phage portal protein [Hungatella effluvii]
MGSLNAFLHPEQAENKEVIISERFKENGKPVPFVIRPITQQENDGLLRKYTKKDKKGNEYFDKVSYNQNLVAAAVVEPDLENSELQRAYGTLGADKTLVAMLYVGEFATLMEAVQGLSGLDKDINEDIDEAKN